MSLECQCYCYILRQDIGHHKHLLLDAVALLQGVVLWHLPWLGLHLHLTEDGDVARPQELPGQGGMSVTFKLELLVVLVLHN